MKVKASVKKRCEYCYIVKRRNNKGKQSMYIYCKRDPRHKQKQA
ncbi:MAG: 50S ribosomal protein L36 [Candidatus Dojkabacteria bacterium]